MDRWALRGEGVVEKVVRGLMDFGVIFRVIRFFSFSTVESEQSQASPPNLYLYLLLFLLFPKAGEPRQATSAGFQFRSGSREKNKEELGQSAQKQLARALSSNK